MSGGMLVSRRARRALLGTVAVLLALPPAALATSPGTNGAIGFTVGNEFAARAKNVVEINPDGSGRVQVTGLAGEVNDLAPVFSPDGNLMAVGRCAAAFGGCGDQIPISILGADGTGERLLTTSYDGTATWSPDGSKLAVLDTTPELGIYVINADGTGRHLLIKGSAGGTGSPTWSPDGTKIAFYDDAFPGDPQALGLYLVDVAGDVNDGSRKHLLLADNALGTGAGACNHFEGYAFDWSPDGKSLLYRCVEPDPMSGGANLDIAKVDASSGAVSMVVATPGAILTGAGTEWFPRWSPDGTKIVYERESAIWTASASGADQHVVAASGFRPSWQPCTSATKRCGPPPAPPAPPATGGGTTTVPVTTATDLCPSADGPASNGGCPINTITFGHTRVTHAGTRLSVKVPGPGTLSVAKTKRTQAVRKHATKAGTVSLTVKPTKAGRQALKRRGSLSTQVAVTYKPDGGRAATTKARIKFIR